MKERDNYKHQPSEDIDWDIAPEFTHEGHDPEKMRARGRLHRAKQEENDQRKTQIKTPLRAIMIDRTPEDL